jgi:hypothetical protein
MERERNIFSNEGWKEKERETEKRFQLFNITVNPSQVTRFKMSVRKQTNKQRRNKETKKETNKQTKKKQRKTERKKENSVSVVTKNFLL